MGRVPSVGKVFFLLDEELGLLPGNLAPRQQEHLIHLACWMPFNKAAGMAEKLLGLQTNEETARRLSERTGRWMEEAQTAALSLEEEDEEEQKDHLQCCAFSVDGAMIPLTHKQWAEVRTLAIGEPQEKLNAKGEKEIHVVKLSYFSRLADASTFTDLAEVEMRRRGVSKAKRVSATMDGADWCQTFADMHRSDAVRILDFPHGSDRKREAMMQYPQFQSDGWPIGSGMVESANKNVVEMRLKGPGMHWERKNVNPLLALRNAICNERWPEMWQKAYLQYRRQEALRRTTRAEQRAEALLALCDPALLSSPPLPPSQPAKPVQAPPVVSAPQPAATLPGSSRPSAHHPEDLRPLMPSQGCYSVSVSLYLIECSRTYRLQKFGAHPYIDQVTSLYRFGQWTEGDQIPNERARNLLSITQFFGRFRDSICKYDN